MSAYEWVIEQESPDGVTTRIVFDFAEDDGSNEHDGGVDHRSSSNGRTSRRHAGAHHRGSRGGRGGRGAPTYAAAYMMPSAQQQLQLQQQSITLNGASTNAFLSLRDGTRSEGGSSKRSSKHSNGSRSRRHRHRGSSAVGGSIGAGSSSNGASGGGVLTSAGSAYTSTALRQRYHRVLFGDRGGSSGDSASAHGAVGSVNFYTRPVVSSSYSASPPPSTLFMSAYGAEVVDEDERSSGSWPPRRSRASTNSSGSGGGSSVVASNPAVLSTTAASATGAYRGGGGHGSPAGGRSGFTVTNTATGLNGGCGGEEGGESRAATAPWAPYTVDSAVTPTTADAPEPFPVAEASESPTRPSWPLSDGSAMDYVDDDNRYCRYVQRDVWAERATCPRTVSVSACDFPAFPPLHPIPLEEEEGERERVDVVSNASRTDADFNWSPDFAASSSSLPGCPSVASQLSSSTIHHSIARTGGPGQGGQAAWTGESEVTEAGQRYNKMLLRKERQRGRGRRGWEATMTGAASSAKVRGPQGQAENNSGSGGGGGQRRARQASSAGQGRSARLPHRLQRGSPSSSSSLAESDDADVEGDSDGSSLEVLSNPSTTSGSTSNDDDDSDDSDEAEALRADLAFSAKVQALASRAGRERRKMEAREERQLQNELLRCEEALLTPPMTALPDAPPPSSSSMLPGLSLAAALRQRDNDFTTAGLQAMQDGRGSRTGERGVGNGRRGSSASLAATAAPQTAASHTPSSFFISPIHQSVAAESSSWTTGTRYQFLGQGGLGDSTPASATAKPAFTAASATAAVNHRTVNGGASHSGSSRMRDSAQGGGSRSGQASSGATRTGRRRGRCDDNKEEEYFEDDDDGESGVAGESSVGLERATVASSLPVNAMKGGKGGPSAPQSKSQARRARKQRKKGDAAQQSVVPECGGSRALRPVAPPSIAPPLELLPCSKKEMCEDMLESFLMAAVLEGDDDFKLL